MPRRRKSLAPETPLTPVPPEILDQFVRQGPLSVEELAAAVRRFKKAVGERALGGELTHHLGYPPGGARPEDVANHRNGTSAKTVLTDDGPLAIDVPRDRDGTFEPRLIPKHARRGISPPAGAARPPITGTWRCSSLRSSTRIALPTRHRRMDTVTHGHRASEFQPTPRTQNF